MQAALTSYLTQVPAMIRRSLRRPSDLDGTTVPAGRVPRRPRDLLPFLSPKLPRFQPGDWPLPGVNWVLAPGGTPARAGKASSFDNGCTQPRRLRRVSLCAAYGGNVSVCVPRQRGGLVVHFSGSKPCFLMGLLEGDGVRATGTGYSAAAP